MANTYWAAEPDSAKAVGNVLERIRRYRETVRTTGQLERMKRSKRAYEGRGPNGDRSSSATQFTGERGEITRVNVNQYATLVNQTVVLTTSTKPAMKAVATNNDFAAQANCQIADQVLDHYDRAMDIDALEVEATRDMVLTAESWMVLDWDANAGEEFSVDENGQPVMTGDISVRVLTALDVAYETRLPKNARQWVAFRYPLPRGDLVALHPELADKLESQQVRQQDSAFDLAFEWDDDTAKRRALVDDADDVVMVWQLRHVPTPALPKGRLLTFVDESCVLMDSMSRTPDGQTADNGYPFGKRLFAYQAVPERTTGTKRPHTPFFDLQSMQEGLDLAATILSSSVNAGGLQNLMVPSAANIEIDQTNGGLNIITYEGAQVPEWSRGVEVPAAVLEWADRVVAFMRQRVGSNDVVSGQPTKGMPAQLAALLRAEAVEFHSGLQRAYERLIQDVRTGMVQLLRKFADKPRTALIVGKASAWAMKEWSGKSLENVEGSLVEPVAPALKTYAGRVALADALLDRGITIGSPASSQYVAMVTTGRLEPLLHDEADNMKRLAQEKEMLMRGIGLPPVAQQVDPMTGTVVPVMDASGLPQFANVPGEFIRPMRWDPHHVDLPELRSVLSMPEVRNNPEVAKAVTDVCNYKMQLWISLSLDELAAYKIPPLPSHTPPPLPAGGPPDGTPPPAPGESSSTGPGSVMTDQADPSAAATRDIKMPSPPPNPLTGEQPPPVA